MNKYLLYAPLAIFGLTGLFLYLFFMQHTQAGSFKENLVPELIGFCLEGFFWIGMLSYFQKTREHSRRKELWLSLRGSLRSFLSYLDIGFLDNHAEPMSSQDLESNPDIIAKMINHLESKDLDLESLILLKEASKDSIALVRDLVPVAAQLSAAHMSWWIAIGDALRQMKKATGREDIEKNVDLLLKNLQEFDQLGY